MSPISRRPIAAAVLSSFSAVISAGVLAIAALMAFAGPAAAQSQGPSVEGCIGCHALGEPAPVGNIGDAFDLHYTDLDPDGPASASGYRQFEVSPSLVDVTGNLIVIEFRVSDEDGNDVANVFDTDGRLVVARLVAPAINGDPNSWLRLVQERFTEGGTFDYLSGGVYRFSSVFDPTSVPIAQGDTLRAAIQISASDIPAGNGWCDFDADLAMANDCTTPTALTRDIIRTPTCNGCHGVTSDVKLSFHGGGRTELEYCVVCHEPNRNPETAMTLMTHKIHYGSELTQEYLGGEYDAVVFTRDIEDCTSCHESGPTDADNWKTVPTRDACGSCHDDVNFDTGENHGSGGIQLTNAFCQNCHPPEINMTGSQIPVAEAHLGQARAEEGGKYRGNGNGIAIESAVFDREADTITVVYSVTRDGVKMDLASDPRWSNGARLSVDLAWATSDYTNEGSNSAPAPGQPVSFNALDIGNTVTELADNSYELVIDVSTFSFGSVTVAIDGHPQADLRSNGMYGSIPVKSPFVHLSVEARTPVVARREIVDIDKCNACHDYAGAGLALHGNNRSGEIQVCVVCHTPTATDIRQRPADPADSIDGKREEAIDMKRMIHQIHMGGDLEEPVAIYGFGGRPHDYAGVRFIGNNANCLTCHLPGTYSADDAWHTLPSTVDSGADPTDPSDDLNISPVTSVCSSCHDSDGSKDHMVANGGTFGSFDSEIATASVPEPSAIGLGVSALAALGLLARRRRRG